MPCLTMLSCTKVIHSWKYIQEWSCSIGVMTEVLGGMCRPELLSTTHIPHGLKWDWTKASVPKGQLLLVYSWPAVCLGTYIVQLHSVWHYAPAAELPILHWSGNTTSEQLRHSGFEVLFRKDRQDVLYELLVHLWPGTGTDTLLDYNEIW
jgi:hypothetical protein